MYNYNVMKGWRTLSVVILVLSGALLTACDEAIVIGEADETSYLLANEAYGYLKDLSTARTAIPVEVRGDAEVQVYLGLTKATATAATARVTVNTALVDAYNTANNTAYPAFPAAQAAIAGGGNLSVAQWRTASDPLAITLSKGALEEQTYLLPVTVSADNVKLSAGADVLYYFVKVAGSIPSTAKPGGVVSICYVEVNSNNPLNVGAYTLQNSGVPFFDFCIIFAANLNFDVAAGRPLIFFNENVAHLLNNRDKYIKPLQDKGIKVLLDILPNHYGIGWNNLNTSAARDIAQQLRAIVDTYGLDGIDFDEEWAEYDKHPEMPPTNTTSYRRMLYELRQVMPDKFITCYYIGTNNSFASQIEGINPGDLVDYSYSASYNPTNIATVPAAFLGMTNAKWGPYPYAFHAVSGIVAYPAISTTNINNLKNGGYGVNLMYDLRGRSDTHPNNAFMDYSDRLTIFSNILYGEPTVAGTIYQKDW